MNYPRSLLIDFAEKPLVIVTKPAKIIRIVVSLSIIVLISGCNQLLDEGSVPSSALSTSPRSSIDDLIGTLSFQYQFPDATEEFEEVFIFTESDIVVDVVEQDRILRILEGNIATVCQYLADVDMFQCSVSESTPVNESSLVSFDYTGGRSGRGWATTGTITLDRGLFGTRIEDRENGISDFAFSWSDGQETFAVDSNNGIVLRLALELSESGEVGNSLICAGSTTDPNRNCTEIEAAPWVRVNSGQGWIASTVGSGGDGIADSMGGLWSLPRSTEAEIRVTTFLFSLDQANAGSGQFEFCTAQSSAFRDPGSIAVDCSRGLIDEPDGNVNVSIGGNTNSLPIDPEAQARRLVSGIAMQVREFNDYKVAFKQATASDTQSLHSADLKDSRISNVISESIKQSQRLR